MALDENKTDVDLLQECKDYIVAGEDYQDKFKKEWDEVNGQIRHERPAEWDNKEDWQTQIFYPLQSNTHEVVRGYLRKMLFPRKFFAVSGVEKKDREKQASIGDLLEQVCDRGRFYVENIYTLDESVAVGTGFIKMFMCPNSRDLKFEFRSLYNVLVDPACGKDFDKARFVIDQYKKDIGFLWAEANKSKSIYDKAVLEQIVKDASSAVTETTKPEAVRVVKSIDGTTDIKIPASWKELEVHEIWAKVKTPLKDEQGNDTWKYTYEDRVITVIDKKYIIRNNKNAFGFIPFQPLRTKPRSRDFYGLGYLERSIGLQNLANTIVNLGFDSLKMCSMDIAIVDEDAIQDTASIQYRPMQTWKVKNPVQNVLLTRQGISALRDILSGLTMVDQMNQDDTGASRHAQGTQSIGGGGSETETLGEFKAKLSMTDQRFLDIGAFIEQDYIIPFIKKVFKVILNPALYDQAKVNRILGFKEIEVTDQETGQTYTKFVEKLSLSELRNVKFVSYDFKATGVIQMTTKLETVGKLTQALNMAVSNPVLMTLTKIPKLVGRVWQALEIPDYEELIKTEEELKAEQEQVTRENIQQDETNRASEMGGAVIQNQLSQPQGGQ